ncbi:Sir2 family [Novymonas esmeraldas]|uniref:Sir2 family n=1 Tax=Novymonas esmeraldas TaxID=1808958 RepID=A0AAW0FC21_9TRYP
MDVPLTEGALPSSQPRCGVCGSPARPDVVLFSESLPEVAWERATAPVRSLQRGDVLLIVGTSGAVQPAASLPGRCRSGIVQVEINTEATLHSAAMDFCVRCPSAVTLPLILQRAKELKTVDG